MNNDSIDYAIEIQKRFREKVDITINAGKENERIITEYDLPEPSFSEWKFTILDSSTRGNILIRRCQYGESKSRVKKKLKASEKWSIFCDCYKKGEYGLPCKHKEHIIYSKFENIVGWNNILNMYLEKHGSHEELIKTYYSKLPKELSILYKKWRYTKPDKNLSIEERKEVRIRILAKIIEFGFKSNSEFNYFVLYYSLNRTLFESNNIKIEVWKIDDYVKSSKFKNFLELLQIVDMRLSQNQRFELLKNRINQYENTEVNNIYDRMRDSKLLFTNFGEDKNLYYEN